MTGPRETRTNAADSAPGVDDGRAGVRPPPVNSKPAGRIAVWIGVVVVLLVVVAAFLAPRLSGERNDRSGFVSSGTTEAEINASRVPGAADRYEANRPVATRPGETGREAAGRGG